MKVTFKRIAKIEVSLSEYDEFIAKLDKRSSLICFTLITREGRAYKSRLKSIKALSEAREIEIREILDEIGVDELFVLKYGKYGVEARYSGNGINNEQAILRIT